jgi:hypothetical protein
MVEKLVLQYKETQERILRSREIWRTQTKQLIKNELSQFVEKYPLDWAIEENNSIENGEVIGVSFKNRPSGLNDKIQMKYITKFGASLSFVMLFNGEIQVIYKYPQIEGIFKKQPEFKSLDICRQDEITPKKIESFFETFLLETIDFENVERKTIGYFQVA